MVRYTHDNEWVRTHEEARALITQCAGGLAVKFATPFDKSARGKAVRYELYHDAYPRAQLGTADIYSLPFATSTVAKHVRTLAAKAADTLKMQLSCNNG